MYTLGGIYDTSSIMIIAVTVRAESMKKLSQAQEGGSFCQQRRKILTCLSDNMRQNDTTYSKIIAYGQNTCKNGSSRAQFHLTFFSQSDTMLFIQGRW